jgi:hypothetical protein
MEDSKYTFTSPNVSGERKQPVVLIAQLMQSIAQMRHVDEAFVWLSNALVRSFELPVVQLWKTELDNTGQFHADLRALTTLDGSLPQEAYLNNQVLFMAERVFHGKKSVRSVPVQGVFPPLQASLCARHDLHYWAGFFLDSNALISASGTVSKPASIPLIVVVSLFTEVPLSGYQIRAMSFVLKQTMRIIINRRFQTFQNSFKVVRKDPDEDTHIALTTIIPMRLQDLQQFQAAVNPLAHPSIIANKRARRVYSAIDGCRNIAELAHITFLDRAELIEALRYLFQLRRIEFYTPSGEHIKHPPPVLYAS